MGMDVYGLNKIGPGWTYEQLDDYHQLSGKDRENAPDPFSVEIDGGARVTQSKGGDAYFRNNVWWWRPVAAFCDDVAPEILERTCAVDYEYDPDEWESRKDYDEFVADRPGADGWHTNSGYGLVDKDCHELALRLSEAIDSGYAQQVEQDIAANNAALKAAASESEYPPSIYPFSEQNVREFRNFLLVCGGFRIW